MSEMGAVASEAATVREAATVWEAAANLPPVLATPLWVYVAGLFEASDLGALRKAALNVRSVLPGSTTHFNEVDVAAGERITLSDPPSAGTPPVVAAYWRLRHQHPCVMHFEQAGATQRPLAISDLIDESTFTRSALYTEVFRGMDVRDQLVIPVPLPGQVTAVTLCVGRREWGFSVAEHVAAQVIQRSLRAAYASLWQQESARTAKAVTSDLLARSGVEVCVVNPFGVIVDLDGGPMSIDPKIAEAISSAGRLVCPETQRLAANGSGEWAAERAPVLVELNVSDSSGEPVTVQVLASDDGEFWPVIARRKSALLRSEDLVARGLTRRQAEVMALLLDGRNTGTAALELGISRRTAEKHIELACRALGVHTRTEALVALASDARRARS